ncbi:MAG: efflux RND transporter periplasmic adaptor subunit [Calditrichae bacterium]|nr:efflux RND transporter periplasmic adaptor subunit [Calditrichota bacterium]MCB9058682.1 efflux RND transporter periplasmic adaptor subunit [Calditrichia bacterium]
MKKTIILLVMLILAACGTDDPQTKLKALEDQRNKINAEIEKLRSEIVASGGAPENHKIVNLQTVQPVVFKHFIKAQGTVVSDNNILIPAQASGVVKKIHVKEGEMVSKGQLLAELDGAIYERNIAEIKTNLELATTVYERQKRLWDKKIGSEIQFLQAKTNKESLENRLATVEEQYRLTKIIAPINGQVDQILIKEAESAAAGFGTIRIVKVTDLKIESFLSEKFINQIHLGDIVTVEIPVIAKSFDAKITAVSQVIDAKNRTFPIEIKLSSDLGNIKPNMLTVLTINDYTNPQAISVPLNLVQNSGNENFLFTATKEAGKDDLWIVKKSSVKTGMNYDNMVEIYDGIQENDLIVSVGYQNLADGQKVKTEVQQ